MVQERMDVVVVVVVQEEEDKKMVPMTGAVQAVAVAVADLEAPEEQVAQVAEQRSQFFFVTMVLEEILQIVF